MTHVTLKQLRYFEALARELHFGRAADICAVTQPALSMQIQQLEDQLGVPLLERTRSGIRLTDRGLGVAERAARVLADVRDLIDYARHSNALLTGPLRLGVIPSMAPYLLPPLLQLLRAEYAGLELYVRETQTQPLLEELTAGKIDVALLALPVRLPDIETMALFDDTFLLALPKTRRLSGRVRADKEMIQNERLLLLEEGHCLRDQALAYCNLRQSQDVNTFGASSLSTIVEMVSAGLGITLLPQMCLNVEERARAIRVIRFVEPEPFRTVGLAWRQTSPRKADFAEVGRLVVAAHERIEAERKADGRTPTEHT